VRPDGVPENFQEYSDSRFGFSVWMPRRFEILKQTIDPLARTLRGLNEMSEEEQEKMQPRLPIGFWDPAVIGELTEGNIQPLRLFEYEAIRGREEPVEEAEIAKMRSDIQGFMPETLASAKMPGYEFLGIGEAMLGPLSAVTFEYRWDGLKPGSFGGDHGFILWAMAPLTMFHVYHHCSGDQWEPRKPELDAILASFQVLEPAAVEPFEFFVPQDVKTDLADASDAAAADAPAAEEGAEPAAEEGAGPAAE
jgi:hypothetical protein